MASFRCFFSPASNYPCIFRPASWTSDPKLLHIRRCDQHSSQWGVLTYINSSLMQFVGDMYTYFECMHYLTNASFPEIYRQQPLELCFSEIEMTTLSRRISPWIPVRKLSTQRIPRKCGVSIGSGAKDRSAVRHRRKSNRSILGLKWGIFSYFALEVLSLLKLERR